MTMLNDENVRIKNMQAGFMISIAVFLDLIQFGTKLLSLIPFIGPFLAMITGWFISFCAGFGFWIWFRLNGIKLMDKMDLKFFVYLIEFIPFINALPGWTFSVTTTIVASRKNDLKKGTEKKLEKRRGVAPQPA